MKHLSAIAVALVLACGCARAAGEVMTFVLEDFPPFNYVENGAASGPVTEVVRETCAAAGIACKFEVYPWRRAYLMVTEGLADGIFVLQRLPEREQYFFFTDPVVRTAFSLFALKSAHVSFSTPCSIRGYTIGAYGPSATSAAAEQLARSSENIRLELEVDNPTVLRKLQNQRYGAHAVAVLNRDVGNHLITQLGMKDIEQAGDIKTVDYAIGLSRKKLTEEQAQRFKQALRGLLRNGRIRAILERHGLRAPGATEKGADWPYGASGC